MIPMILNFETSNGRIMLKLNFDFKQRKLFLSFMVAENFSFFSETILGTYFLSKQFIPLVQN